jgi:hypothetical protein
VASFDAQPCLQAAGRIVEAAVGDLAIAGRRFLTETRVPLHEQYVTTVVDARISAGQADDATADNHGLEVH